MLFSLKVSKAQIAIQFVPEVYGRNVNGLLGCQFVNSGAPRLVSLAISVTERNAGTICVVRLPQFTLSRGASAIPANAARQAAIQFSSAQTGRLTRLTNSFPAGDYDYCFTLSFINSDLADEEQCFDYTLAPFAELSLIDPYDHEKLCNTKPVFTWQPLIPNLAGTNYQLVLTEIKDGQNATEAINYNLPIINQRNIAGPILNYPPVVRELQSGKKYAWQVTAYKDVTILNRSEVWEFDMDCNDTVAKAPNKEDGYRDIEDLVAGNFYVANGHVRFALINSYQPVDLKYEIKPTGNLEKKVKKLPKIKIAKGNNKINIDLEKNSDMVSGSSYILTVWLPNGSVKNLRFIYYDEK